MKHNHNHDNVRCVGLQMVPVRFEFTHPTTATVCITGTFNHWQAEAKTPHSSSVSRWWKEISPVSSTYKYYSIVEDFWMPDPLARESVSNLFGEGNSILKAPRSPKAAHLADAENFPLKKQS